MGGQTVSAVTLFSPAKLNLFLAVTGRRADGFHDLVSLVAPVDFGDELEVSARENGFALECDDPAVPGDEHNLVLKAARAFALAAGWRGGAHFKLGKRIPVGAGLGGGSSNAVAALRGLNRLAGQPLGEAELAGLAAGLGSDCALFLAGAPVIMRGRGEQIERLTGADRARLTGRRVLIFKPAFGIATPWAYARLAGAPENYLPAAAAEARLAAWCERAEAPLEELLYNNLESAVFEKYLALPVLLAELRERFGLAPRMSGSGSACFALLPDGAPVPSIVAVIREAWGEGAFVAEGRLL